jgi:hypothetical protein
MAKSKYKFNINMTVKTRQFGEVSNATLTDEIAEYLLATGAYNDLISLIPQQPKENSDGFKKSNRKTD